VEWWVTKPWGWENWESRGFHSEIERENESRGISSAGRNFKRQD
jgi:hypothetical protein